MKKYMTVKMPDDTTWAVPVEKIARNRAAHYAREFGGNIEKSLSDDTIPLFTQDESEIIEWAVNNMNWDDVAGDAMLVSENGEYDYQEGWMSGEKNLCHKITEETKAVITIKQEPSEREGRVNISVMFEFYPQIDVDAVNHLRCHALALEAIASLNMKDRK